MQKYINPLIKIFLLLVVFTSGTRSFAYTNGLQESYRVDNINISWVDSVDSWDIGVYTNTGTNPLLVGCYITKATTTDYLNIGDYIYSDNSSGLLLSGAGCDSYSTSFFNVDYSILANGIYYVYQLSSGISMGANNQNLYYRGDYISFEVIGGVVIPIAPEDRTRIITLEPENNFIASSTGISTEVIYNFVYNINENDIGKTFSVQVFLKNYDQNTLFGFASDNQIEFLDFVATSSGIGALTGYMTLPNGNYMIKGQLKKSLWGFTLPKVGIIDEKENQFIVGSSTFIGGLVQNSRDSINDEFNASSTIDMTYKDKINTCNPLSIFSSTTVKFNPILCVGVLFVPDGILINNSLSNLRINVLQSFPIGYVTDFVEIMATTSTSTLTVINATLPSVLPGGGANIRLDLYRALDWALYATSSKFNNVSASSTKTLFEITNGYWKIIVYLGALFYILSRLLGTRIVPNGFGSHSSLSDTFDNDDSYVLKEKLYNMSKRK